MLTLEQLKNMEPYTVIATGVVANNPDGVYMTDQGFNRPLRWVAKRGQIHDWTIYIHWAERDEEWVKDWGDKVRDRDNIKKLVPCTDDAFRMYRF